MLRRLQVLVLAVVLVVAAFSTGWPFLFFLVYVGLLVGGGSYILTRLGLSDLEAGYAVSQLSGARRRSPAGHLHAAQHRPAAQAVAGDPQPHHAPRRAAGPGALAAAAARSGPGWSGRPRAARALPDRAAPDPHGRPVRLLRGVGRGGAGDHARRLPARRGPAAVAAATGEHRGRARLARAHAPDHAARDDGSPVRAGRLDEPDPLAHDGAPGRDPGQGVRPRADRRRLDLPGPRRGRWRPAPATTPRPRSRSVPRRPSPTRRWPRTVPWG